MLLMIKMIKIYLPCIPLVSVPAGDNLFDKEIQGKGSQCKGAEEDSQDVPL